MLHHVSASILIVVRASTQRQTVCDPCPLSQLRKFSSRHAHRVLVCIAMTVARRRANEPLEGFGAGCRLVPRSRATNPTRTQLHRRNSCRRKQKIAHCIEAPATTDVASTPNLFAIELRDNPCSLLPPESRGDCFFSECGRTLLKCSKSLSQLHQCRPGVTQVRVLHTVAHEGF